MKNIILIILLFIIPISVQATTVVLDCSNNKDGKIYTFKECMFYYDSTSFLILKDGSRVILPTNCFIKAKED